MSWFGKIITDLDGRTGGGNELGKKMSLSAFA